MDQIEAGMQDTRLDIYRGIHKALRAFMCDTLALLGRLDTEDEQEVMAATAQVRTLAKFCEQHLEHENQFIHPAMEARRPGSSGTTAGDHIHHAAAIGEARVLAAWLEQGAAERRDAVVALHRLLTRFVADNLQHMEIEETANNAVLWATHSDAELAAIEQAIVASIDPEDMALCLRWMMIGMNPTERLELLAGMRQRAPAPVFEGALAVACSCLGARDWEKLADGLAAPDRLAA